MDAREALIESQETAKMYHDQDDRDPEPFQVEDWVKIEEMEPGKEKRSNTVILDPIGS